MKMNGNYLRYISALLLFGSNGIVASYILLNSYEIVFLRTFIGGLFLLAVFLITKGKFRGLQNKKHLTYLAISGAAMGASWMFLFEAYRQIGVSLATLAYYCGPVIVMALAPLVFKEKMVPVKIFGFLAVLVGMFLVNRHTLMQNGFSWGLLYGVMAAMLYAFMVIFNKKAVRITGLENAVWQLAVGFITVALFTVIKQGIVIPVTSGSLFPILLLGILNTGIGCYLYFSAIQHLPAQSVAILGYLEPLSALIFSAAILQERLTFVQMMGAVLILGGAAFGEYFRRKQLPNLSPVKLS
jgi:drug/metabolite transporter (DMT)-like permease